MDQEKPLYLTEEGFNGSVVIAMENIKLLPYTMDNIKGKMECKAISSVSNPTNEYIIHTGNVIIENQLIKLVENKVDNGRDIGITNVLLVNDTPNTLKVRKGKILGYANYISKEEKEGICTITEMLAQLSTPVEALSVVSESGSIYPDTSQLLLQNTGSDIRYKNNQTEGCLSKEKGVVTL